MLIQLRGKVRRAVVGAMLSEEDRAGIAGARHGECNRCGACCKILFACPFLVDDKGVFTCSVYDHRPPSCRLFPMVPADLREVDRCAFSFETPRGRAGRPSDGGHDRGPPGPRVAGMSHDGNHPEMNDSTSHATLGGVVSTE
jgi:hypothetical protein